MMNKYLSLLALLLVSLNLSAQTPIYSWTFDEDSASYQLLGKGHLVPGVSEQAYLFDGFTSALIDQPDETIQMPREFTITAWIAMGAYPWNWAPILTIGKYQITGFYFGIDAHGCLGFQMSDATSIWHAAASSVDEKTLVGMELHHWYHVAATYSRSEGIKIYINGELQDQYNDFQFAYGVRYSELEKGFQIGMNREKLPPADPIRDWATWPSQYSFDGIMDEIKVYEGAWSGDQMKEEYARNRPESQPEFADRDFPEIPSSGRFGANYTRLEYYPEWDNLWPVGDHMDIAVQFEDLPIRVMFWRGSRYSPCWVSENNKWMADQSRETGYNWYLQNGDRNLLPTGCMEHMSDVQCRSSRVAIIENTDARVVVNWRYLQMDVQFRQKNLPDNSEFGEWASEMYYIYPDGVGIRHVLPGRGGWQETIFFSAPGTRPEDNVELEACTLLNMDGDSKTYSWEHGYPKFDLEDANIQRINFKSKFKPFLILQEGGGFLVFNGEVRPAYSHFPWWNHWPVAQISSDGRSASAPDRAAHSSLSWGLRYGNAAMYGMSDQPEDHLVQLAKSWNRPPEVNVMDRNFICEGYEKTQRAYFFRAKLAHVPLHFEILANQDHPLENLALVILNWSSDEFTLIQNNKLLKEKVDFRCGLRPEIDGTQTLILFIPLQSESKEEFEIIPIQ